MRKDPMHLARKWFQSNGWKPFPFQEISWQKVLDANDGLLNAPTGSGKTYSLLLPLLERIRNDERKGLKIIWVSPIRALTKEILQASQKAIFGLGLSLTVEIRTGDTSSKDKARQKSQMPDILITTPESLHILFAQKKHTKHFRILQAVVVDEWHELLGSKRGVLMELALARFRTLRPELITWGISATIGNLQEAMEVLLSPTRAKKGLIIRADLEKKIEVVSVLPDSIEKIPWAGHLGIRLLPELLPLIELSQTSLIFTNTRSQAEIWYQRLLEANPDLSGRMAMHHGSISRELRFWVEEALFHGNIKAVVCTSSLDLGVDFRPVDRIFQIGSPKGVARFLQRAGRSGHQPGAVSRIHFIPTHALELVEAAALREAIAEEVVEERLPHVRSFDVLLQYMTTLAVSDGFYSDELYKEISSCFCFDSVSQEEWQSCLNFLTTGGSLSAYDDYHKVMVDEDGRHYVDSRRIARRHRFSIGTIVSDTMIRVKLKRGGVLGHVEEYFISRLKPGDVFWFAGLHLELIQLREMTATVQKARSKKGVVSSWAGSRMPLSAQMGQMLRKKLNQAAASGDGHPELELLAPMLELQKEMSIIPKENEFLIEYLRDEEGHHLFFYPFEGRFVHEGMAALLAWRISLFCPISFSIAMNDYGFELLSDEAPPLDEMLDAELFNTENLREDISQSLNSVEMARRRFRDIAAIAGLVFQGYPGQQIKERHLQSSSALIFDVFSDFDPDNLLLKQAYDEALHFQLEESRMREALDRIAQQKLNIIELERPGPLCFPILVDRLNREHLSSEQLDQRIARMVQQHRAQLE